jgi:hypothetical protein
VPTNRSPIERTGRRLTYNQRYSLEFGDPQQMPPAFRDDVERREAWARHREFILEDWHHGTRPRAWWAYENHGLTYPQNFAYEAATLFEAGLLADSEREFLLKRWRQQFDQAQPDNFQHCIGLQPSATFACWLKGDAAREAHYRWAGIPRSLLKQWAAERRRQDRILRKLKAETMLPSSKKEAPR